MIATLWIASLLLVAFVFYCVGLLRGVLKTQRSVQNLIAKGLLIPNIAAMFSAPTVPFADQERTLDVDDDVDPRHARFQAPGDPSPYI